MGLPLKTSPSSAAFQSAKGISQALTSVALLLLFLEFFTLSFGISILFEKVNVFQVLLHFAGCVHIGMMILQRYNYTQLWPIVVFYVLIPFVLEIAIIFQACLKYRVVWQIEDQKTKRLDALTAEFSRRYN